MDSSSLSCLEIALSWQVSSQMGIGVSDLIDDRSFNSVS